MHYDIAFPNLGIELGYVPKSFNIGNFTVALYGVVIALGMLLGVSLAMKLCSYRELDSDKVVDVILAAIVVGIIGARIYYVVFAWDFYRDNPLSAFNIREGGLAIYGGVIGGFLGVLLGAKLKKLSPWKILDVMAPGILIGQILGRWGNFFNREAFGEYTDGLLAMRLPVDAIRFREVTDLMKLNMQNINGIDYVQVSPTFLYESLWNLGVLILILIFYRKIRFDGQGILWYFMGYGAGRFWVEGLRTDQLLLWKTSIPVSQLLAAIMVVAAGVIWVVTELRLKRKE